ncbi:hypothetical protein F5884DRAFT_852264 [Xylogone sp. PMI_703]|nr:hypothetical protein F5884DRAFT_852264 [Xylogone sp. PMI_703]
MGDTFPADANQAQPLVHQQTPQTPSLILNPNKFRRDFPPRSVPSVTMSPNDAPMKMESFGNAMWSAPTPPTVRKQRPATIHESGFSYYLPQDYTALSSTWETPTTTMLQMHEEMGHAYPGQELYPPSSMSNNGWTTKTCDDGMDMHGLDHEMHLGHAYTTDESMQILDLRYSTPNMDDHHLGFENSFNSRRMSGSSFTLSTTGPVSEMMSHEDFSATMSETQSYTSDYPMRSNRNSLMSSTQLSPVASPRIAPQQRPELVRTQSRGRASPSPRPSMRSAPYTIDATRTKRWSTGSYALPNRRASPFVYHPHEAFATLQSHHSSPTLPPNNPMPLAMNTLQSQQPPFLLSSNAGFHRNAMLLPSHNFPEPTHFENPPPLLSHGLFRMLQSNADPQSLHTHYAELSDPPNLYASLSEDALDPPPEDMRPEDPDMIPHEQELRFDGDLYTPRWVRGHGNKREGWCGICKPGRWLVLKNSAFWYDKSFTHGISAATGSPFQEPQETRRMDGNPDVWEGLCGSCGEWVALVSSKKKGTTWFRHAYKCHTHPKIKDAPKRRRESSHTRATGTANINQTPTKSKVDVPMTPQMTPIPSMSNTPTLDGGIVQHKMISPLEGLSSMI